MPSDTRPFFDLLSRALDSGQFVKATLSRPCGGAPGDLRNIFLRPVMLRGERMVSWTYRYERRDEVKNLTLGETVGRLRELCGASFRNATLFTSGAEATLSHNRRGEAAVTIRETAGQGAVPQDHDRDKNRMLAPGSPWLQELGIAGAGGAILPSSQAKWRQINKFLEIVSSLHRSAGLAKEPRIADMGCGKGYLTFALYEYLTGAGLAPRITGVEQRAELVAFCNAVAQRSGFTGLQFEAGRIGEWETGSLDALIALHACDTATDEAIAAGIRAGATVIITSPCCQRQVRQAMHPPALLSPLLRHGILMERQAEILTDGLRALLMEAHGYRTSVFEFISTEHTAKNLMITGIRQGGPSAAAMEEIAALKQAFGIREHRLETLLAAD